MKINELFESALDNKTAYKEWIKAVCKVHPNATVDGDYQQAQMTVWDSKTNEVAGNWDGKSGVIYKPGSKGKETI